MATTSLGTLTLDLAVRLSEFTDGLSRAERETRDRTQEMSDSVGKFKEKLMDDLSGTAIGDAVGSLNEKLSSITEAFGENGLAGAAAIGAASIIGSVAAIGAGLVTLALQTAEADEQLVRLATRAKTSTENLQVLTAATGAYGLEMESVGDILADAQEKLGEFSANGGGGLVDTLELMQNATKKTDAELEIFGKSLSTMDSVDAIQAVVNEMERAGATTQEVRFVTESLASGLGDIIPLWDNNGEALRNYERDLNEAGVIRTKESIEQSQILANEVEGLKIKFEGVSNQLVTAALPAMATLIEYFKEGTTQGGSFKNEISGVGKAINITAASVVGLAAGMGLLINSFSAVGRQMANIGQTAQNFYNADNLADKGKALFTGFFSAGALASGSMLDISSQWANDMETITKLLDGASSKMNKINTQRPSVNNAFGSVLTSKGNNVAFPYRNDGIPYRTGAISAEIIASRAIADAEEAEAKAKEKTAKANDKKTASIKKQAEAQARLVGISGDTGVGNAHLHIQYRDKNRPVSAADLARFQANGKSIASYGKTSGYGPRNTGIKGASTYHRGTDFGVPKNTPITTNVPVKGVKTWLDKKGGGYVSTVTFGDGVVIDLLHQMPGVMGIEKGQTTGNSQIDGAIKNADAMWQKSAADAARAQEKAAADAIRAQEETLRKQASIAGKWAYEKEKIEIDYQNNKAEVEEAHAKGSADYIKYMARVEEKYIKDKNAGVLSLSEKYFSEEQKIHDDHKKAMLAIDETYIEDDSVRQYYVDAQKAAYAEDLENFRFAAGAKAREQDKIYQSIANSAKANGINSLSTGLDSMAQRTMSADDYSVWRLGQDHDEAFDSVNNQYSDRQKEINAKDERGKFELPELERNELLEIAKQEHLDNMWAMEQDYALKEQTLSTQLQNAKLDNYANTMGAMGSLLGAFAGENNRISRMMFSAQQGYALAQIYLNNKVAISEAWASAPFPYNASAVAMALLETGALATAAQAITPMFSGIAHGGLDYVPKESTYLLDKGERVLSPRQNTDLTNFMASSQKTNEANVNISVAVDARGNSQMTGDVSDALGRKMAEGMKQVAKSVIMHEQRPGGLLYGT